MTNLDPKVPVTEAILWAGSQAELGRKLGVHRAAVSQWLAADRVFLPPLQAHRYVTLRRIESTR